MEIHLEDMMVEMMAYLMVEKTVGVMEVKMA
jgi:hypothetical protein